MLQSLSFNKCNRSISVYIYGYIYSIVTDSRSNSMQGVNFTKAVKSFLMNIQVNGKRKNAKSHIAKI